jgi:leucine dehydrogenase
MIHRHKLTKTKVVQMLTFEKLYQEGHEEVVFFSDPSCNLKAIVAIHSTILGPSLGGTRMWPYKNEDEAIKDVLRLSKGMTYKASISGLNLGGGKAVIMGDPEKDKSEALFRSYGKFIESLNGRYVTAEDVNINVDDIQDIYKETSFVTGVSQAHGGSGNPAPYTALGVFRGIEASLLKVFGDSSVKGKTFALQGAGAVGRLLGKLLDSNGAKVFVSDINRKNIDLFKQDVPSSEVVSVDDIYTIKCDVYTPCALGGTVNDETIDKLKCKIVAGSANNQLARDEHGDILKKKNILYAPDYLINAGGLMNVSTEFEGWSHEKSERMVNTIFDTTLKIFKFSEENNLPVYKATDLMAEKRIESIRKLQGKFIRSSSPRFPGRTRSPFLG